MVDVQPENVIVGVFVKILITGLSGGLLAVQNERSTFRRLAV
jgi:hypothetical protein